MHRGGKKLQIIATQMNCITLKSIYGTLFLLPAVKSHMLTDKMIQQVQKKSLNASMHYQLFIPLPTFSLQLLFIWKYPIRFAHIYSFTPVSGGARSYECRMTISFTYQGKDMLSLAKERERTNTRRPK